MFETLKRVGWSYENMKEVKTYPKFKCDFCKRKSVKHIMIKHEASCYLNPNRVCWKCENRGEHSEEYETACGTDWATVPCKYCELYKKITEEIKASEIIIQGYKNEMPF